MERNVFKDYASNENNADWERHIERQAPLYIARMIYVLNMSVITHVYFIRLHIVD